jgi:hypothetical protein
MKNFSLFCSALFLLVSTGCATIFTGTEDEIYFNSKPEGAVIYIDGIRICQTPCSADIDRSVKQKLGEARLKGYSTRVFELDTDFNLASILNFTNVLFWGIDFVTGAVVKHDPLVYYFDFTEDGKMASQEFSPFRVDIDTQKKQLDLYVLENASTTK